MDKILVSPVFLEAHPLPIMLVVQLSFLQIIGLLIIIIPAILVLDGYRLLRYFNQIHDSKSRPPLSLIHPLIEKFAPSSSSPPSLAPTGYHCYHYDSDEPYQTDRLDKRDKIGLVTVTSFIFVALALSSFWIPDIEVFFSTIFSALAFYAMLRWGIRANFTYKANFQSSLFILFCAFLLGHFAIRQMVSISPFLLSTSTSVGIILGVNFVLLPILLSGVLAHLLRLFISKSPQDSGHSEIYCATCQHPMQSIDENTISNYLTQTQNNAVKENSKRFDALYCPHCYPNPTPRTIHLLEYEKSAPGTSHHRRSRTSRRRRSRTSGGSYGYGVGSSDGGGSDGGGSDGGAGGGDGGDGGGGV
jgi:uncharacterized membrane protein YgcG